MLIAHTFNPSPWGGAEAVRSLWVQGQRGLGREFQNSQNCDREKPISKNNKKKKQEKKEKWALKKI